MMPCLRGRIPIETRVSCNKWSQARQCTLPSLQKLFRAVMMVFQSDDNCRGPIPVWCLGQDMEFDCIGS